MINIKDLCFSYTGTSPYLIDNVNLDIPKGVYLSIVGENGSGKTTLLKLILGLLKPSKGSIEINSDKIGYVPQRVEGFNSEFPITVNEVLKMHSRAIGIKDASDINCALKHVDMLNYKNRLIGGLSGGQQQRVFIARALIGDPELIILDEPSTGVDHKNQHSIYSLLYTLNKSCKKTIISVEHNIDLALKYSSHIVEVVDGTPTLYTTSEYMKHRTESLKKVISL
ncbi:metal ABC transporter ATP-binding protein [Clostridium chrysemydis]|uniref:metal ABC transporter ATP-binding protein n=1 Tax=Clostridium chrysemydis TaxID=2665504 RepID=UPI0018844A1B|nr:metal ABC transporter ATP-binding protein [Clostridium chrysemydis]